jgi:D-xylose transport system permease protein
VTNHPAETVPQNSEATPKTSQRHLIAHVVRTYGILIALILLWIVFTALTNGVFIEPRNLSNLIRQTAVTGILAVGMEIVIVAGEIDLSVGSLVGLSGMVAVLAQSSFHSGLATSIALGIATGLLIGALQGTLVAYGQVPSFIVTLGGLLAWRGAAKGLSGGNTYPIEIHAFKSIGQSYLSPVAGATLAAICVAATTWHVLRRNWARRRFGLGVWSTGAVTGRILLPALLAVLFVVVLNMYAGVPIPVVIFLCIALAGAFLMRNTIFGRHLYAIGGNSEAAELSGVNLRTNILAAFCILGALSGMAGIIYTARVGSAGPDAGTLLELDAIAACVIGGASLMGGRGTVFGACLGALFMASLDNGMSLKDIPDFIQDIVKGGVLVTAVLLDVLGRRTRTSITRKM